MRGSAKREKKEKKKKKKKEKKKRKKNWIWPWPFQPAFCCRLYIYVWYTYADTKWMFNIAISTKTSHHMLSWSCVFTSKTKMWRQRYSRISSIPQMCSFYSYSTAFLCNIVGQHIRAVANHRAQPLVGSMSLSNFWRHTGWKGVPHARTNAETPKRTPA